MANPGQFTADQGGHTLMAEQIILIFTDGNIAHPGTFDAKVHQSTENIPVSERLCKLEI